MPGVPSGKGCDACRRSRKKCDEQQPQCMRCIRLGRKCINSGKQRFVFKPPLESSPTIVPSNATSRLRSAFVSHLNIKDVPGHDFIWTFGDILQDIPARLGIHSALDAAANALVATSPCLATTANPTTRTRVAYIEGLHGLREAIVGLGPGRGGTAPIELWLAVYLLWICQGWFGLVDDINPGHAQGLLRLWNVLEPGSWSTMDAFHRRVTLILIIPVVLESLFDPTIILSPSVWTLAQDIDSAIAGEEMVRLICRSPDHCNPLTSQLWVAHCSLRIQEILTHYEIHLAEASALRKSGQQVLIWLCSQTDRISPLQQPATSKNDNGRYQHATHLRTYSFTTALLLLLNGGTAHFATCDQAGLSAERASLIDDLIRKAHLAQQYRPLGALGSTWALLIAWASLSSLVLDPAEEGEKQKSEIVSLLVQSHVAGINARTHYMMRQAEGMFSRLFPERGLVHT